MNEHLDRYDNEELLLLEFNERTDRAFSEVYVRVFDELNHFAERLFYTSGISSEDLIQDIFVSIWSHRKVHFDSIAHLKNYLYNSIKNKHKDFLKHKVCHENFESEVRCIDDYHYCQIIENEVITILSVADTILTTECAKVLRLYLEGYDVKEIATKLKKSHNTVYHQRVEAVSTLRDYFFKRKITFFFHLL